MLEYVVKQLKADNTLDLVVLGELMHRMAGLESRENASEAELHSLAGGPVLRAEVAAGQPAAARAPRKTSQRLLASLVESRLAVPLWLLLARFAVTAIYKTDIAHLKLLGILTDQCHAIFLQFSQFVLQHAQEAGLALGDLPTAAALQAQGIEPDFAAYMRRHWERVLTGRSALELLLAEAPPGAPLGALQPAVLAAFWRLDLGDLWVPEACYAEQAARLRAMLAQAEPPLLLAEPDKARWLQDRERAPRAAAALEAEARLRLEAVRLGTAWLAEHRAELFQPAGARAAIIENLLQHCIFPRALFSPEDAIYAARFLHTLHMVGAPNFSSLSCYDRLFIQVAGVIFGLTEREAHCYGRFLGEVLSVLHAWHANRALYDAEAIGGGRPGFFTKWNARKPGDAAVELADPAARSPDAADDAPPGGSPAADAAGTPTPPAAADDLLGYDDFRHVMYKWHLKLHSAFVRALESGDYQHIRNAIIILSRLSLPTTLLSVGPFPVLRKIGANLEKAVQKVKADEEGRREDLRLLATRCEAMLAAGRARWLPEDQFHHLPPRPEAVPRTAAPSPKRNRDPGEDDVEKRVKKLRISEKAPEDGPAARKPAANKSAETAERELRRQLEERKRKQDTAAGSSPPPPVPTPAPVPVPAYTAPPSSRPASARSRDQREHHRGDSQRGDYRPEQPREQLREQLREQMREQPREQPREPQREQSREQQREQPREQSREQQREQSRDQPREHRESRDQRGDSSRSMYSSSSSRRR